MNIVTMTSRGKRSVPYVEVIISKRRYKDRKKEFLDSRCITVKFDEKEEINMDKIKELVIKALN